MITDQQKRWDEFLIKCWFEQKQARMNTVETSFDIDEGMNCDHLKRRPNDPFSRMSDVFGFVAKYLPRLSALLLNTKAGDTARIAKIVKFMRELRTYEDKSSARYHQKAIQAGIYAGRVADSESASHLLVKNQRSTTGKSVWNQCK